MKLKWLTCPPNLKFKIAPVLFENKLTFSILKFPQEGTNSCESHASIHQYYVHDSLSVSNCVLVTYWYPNHVDLKYVMYK
jgi:hypothetical protein